VLAIGFSLLQFASINFICYQHFTAGAGKVGTFLSVPRTGNLFMLGGSGHVQDRLGKWPQLLGDHLATPFFSTNDVPLWTRLEPRSSPGSHPVNNVTVDGDIRSTSCTLLQKSLPLQDKYYYSSPLCHLNRFSHKDFRQDARAHPSRCCCSSRGLLFRRLRSIKIRPILDSNRILPPG